MNKTKLTKHYLQIWLRGSDEGEAKRTASDIAALTNLSVDVRELGSNRLTARVNSIARKRQIKAAIAKAKAIDNRTARYLRNHGKRSDRLLRSQLTKS